MIPRNHESKRLQVHSICFSKTDTLVRSHLAVQLERLTYVVQPK